MLRTELHHHLDASFRLETTYELGQKKGLIPESTSFEAFRDDFILNRPMKDLDEVLGKIDFFQKLLDRPEVLERVAKEALEDAYRDGTRRIEFRFSPGFTCRLSGLSWDDALAAFENGLNSADCPEMQFGFICIGTRDYGVDHIAETVEFFLKNEKRFVGIDLAGSETQYPPKLYESIFRGLKDKNVTIHAGEAAGPDYVWQAIDLLGAKRIGHGIASIRDPKLMDTLRDRKIGIETCPTSNRVTRTVPSLREHPLKAFLDHGICATVSTDDPGVFGVTLSHELELARCEMGLTDSDIELCLRNAEKVSFI